MIPIGVEQFYPKPLSPQTFVHEWFSTDPCPRNFLESLLKNAVLEAGVQKSLTNHSLRAAGATAMFQAGIPEKLIAEHTGHRSQKSLRLYECQTNFNDHEVSVSSHLSQCLFATFGR